MYRYTVVSHARSQERSRRFTYQFVLRMRPDLELSARFPSIPNWRCLRTDVVWTMHARHSNGAAIASRSKVWSWSACAMLEVVP